MMAQQIGIKEHELDQVQQLRTEYLDLRRQIDALQAVLEQADDEVLALSATSSRRSRRWSAARADHVDEPAEQGTSSEDYREDSVELKLTEVSLAAAGRPDVPDREGASAAAHHPPAGEEAACATSTSSTSRDGARC